MPSKTRGHRYLPNFDILMLLRYLAGQSFMSIAGQLLGFSTTSAHRIDRLCSLHDLLITFPDDFCPAKHKFCLKSGLLDIIGAIDCTHTKVQSFGRESGERYRNRKGFFPWMFKVSAIPTCSFWTSWCSGLDLCMTVGSSTPQGWKKG